jgi:hypothetical protein
LQSDNPSSSAFYESHRTCHSEYRIKPASTCTVSVERWASLGEAMKDVPGPKNVHELLVGWAEGVSKSHIVLTTMIDSVDEWGLVR